MQSLIHLSWVDWLVILVYFVFVITIGLYLKKFTITSEDFFMAGRRNSAWVAGLAFLSANMGALELLGMSGQSYQYGMLTTHFYWIGAVPAMLFLGIFMMPFYYSSKIHSVPEYLNLRFNSSTRTLNAVAFAVMTLLVAGINLYAMALVLNIFVGWSMAASLWIGTLVIGVYILLGGLASAIFTEVIQFFLIWFGILLAVILGFHFVGGWNGLHQTLPDNMFHLWSHTGTASDNPMFINWMGIAMGLGFVLSFGYWTTDFLVVQRAMAAKDMKAAQRAPVIAAFFKMLLPVIVILPGIIVLAMVKSGQIPTLPTPDDSLLFLINKFYPHGLLGLGVTALLAGFMSGQAGNITAFNAVFTYDIYRAHINKRAHDHHYVKVGRWATVFGMFVSILTAYWAMGMPSIMEYMQALFSIVNAPLFGAILLGMFWPRATGKGAFWGLLIGMGTATVLFFLSHFNKLPLAIFAFDENASALATDFWRAVWAFGITVIVLVSISLLSTPKRASDLHGLVYQWGKRAERTTESLWKRPGFWAIIAIIVFVALNIWFW
jgi:SSS family solute:Na+ symporter